MTAGHGSGPIDATRAISNGGRDHRRGRRVAQVVGFALALVLLAGSIYYAVRDGNFQPLREAEWPWVAALLGATAFSAVLVPGLLFWLVYEPFADRARPVRLHEMLLIIAASALLNYTPVKAGLIGRLAYMKHRHGIGYSASVLIHAMIAGALLASLCGMLGVTLLRPRVDAVWWVALAGSVPAFALIGAAIVQRILPRRIADAAPGEDTARLRHSFGWSAAHLSGWIVVGHVMLLVTAVRWWLVCRIMDQSIAGSDALLMAVTHSASSVLPANGLGLREWLIGALFGGEAPADFVAVSLIDRAAEAIVVVVSGLAGLAWLHRGLRRISRAADRLSGAADEA